MIYADLRLDIERHTSNSDPEFIASIDRFIRQAENRIGVHTKIPNYDKVTSLVTVAAANTVTPPADFISVDHISIPGYGILEQKEDSFMSEAYPDTAEQGQPRYFAMLNDNTIVLGPTPDAIYTMPTHYFAKWPSIVDLGQNPSTANQETFISSKFEVALLRGSLMFAAMWMKDTDSYNLEKTEMMEALGLITKFSKGRAVKQESENGNAALPNGELS